MDTIFTPKTRVPLAELLRPADFSDFVGQEHILSKDKLLRRLIDFDRISSMILWGPPGCGKTTLAYIIAKKTNSEFITISAVSSGIKEAREIIKEAEANFSLGKKTILFIDEIHRFNKAQQDYFLPFIEKGVVIFIGATTENPSFEVNSPILSRARVFHLRELTPDNIIELLKQAAKRINNSLETTFEKIDYPKDIKKVRKIAIDPKAAKYIATLCEGDARDAYNALELSLVSTQPDKNGKLVITSEMAEDSMQQKFIRYDKGADGHFDAISALHKSLRSSDVDAALHYTARMIEAGEDPLYVVRRLIRFASEDIGMADPQALILAVSTERAVSMIGLPECELAIAECVIYLAKAPKSRAVDSAYVAAKNDVNNMRLDPIPLKIRNAETKMMKDFGFGKDYKMYDEESRLPENLKGKKYWKEDS